MTPEKPAQGILKRNNWGDAMLYEVACDCGDSDHAHQVWVEADDAFVTVTIYTKVKSKWWSMNRWKKIWTLLTRGYVEYESSTIMTQQQAINYADVLQRSVADCQTFSEQRKKKHDQSTVQHP